MCNKQFKCHFVRDVSFLQCEAMQMNQKIILSLNLLLLRAVFIFMTFHNRPVYFRKFHNINIFLYVIYYYISSLRMRRKNWKNPATVYVDSQVFEENIQVYANFEVFLEILEGILYCNKLVKHLDNQHLSYRS